MAFAWADLCDLILAFPGVEAATSYGTPAFKVRVPVPILRRFRAESWRAAATRKQVKGFDWARP